MGNIFKALSKAQSESDGPSLQNHEESPVRRSSKENNGSQQASSERSTSRMTRGDISHSVKSEKFQEESLFTVDPSDEIGSGSFEQWDEKLLLFTKTPEIAESFRKIRNKILFPGNDKPIKNILVTSAERGTGKSTISACLGYYLSQGMDEHALLVDCDLRLSTLPGMFGVRNDSGLSNYLQDQVELGGLIRKTGLRKLSILPGGPRPGNPSELIGSRKMADMIKELVGRYKDRFLVLDSPPVNSASETANLCQYVDGVLLVVKHLGTGRDKMKELVDTIGKDKIIGVVFNACKKTVVDSLLNKSNEDTAY